MIENKSAASRIRIVITYAIVILLALLCLLPLWHMVCISFSDATMVEANRVFFWPVKFTVNAYVRIMEDSQFWRSFGRSIVVVILGLLTQLPLMMLLAYPLSKTEREFKGRNFCMGFLVFAMLFSGGMIPTYLVVKELHLLNTIWALVLPYAVPVANVIMMMNFFTGIPQSLEEAAIIDGASPLQVLLHVIVPCSKPCIATMALFSIVGHWNAFYPGLVYMIKAEKYPLMSYISTLQMDMGELAKYNMSAEEMASLMEISGKNMNAAKVMIATIPLLLIYPFLQKYLITGIVMGSVKE